MKDVETRYFAATVELRSGDSGLKLGGYAIKYDKISQNLGGFVERIAPGALNQTLAEGGDILARYEHEDRFLLGRTSAGTLRLMPDEIGLGYEVDLPDTSYARDLAALAERGDVRYSSFAFIAKDEKWSTTERGYTLRTVTALHLLDVAPVVNPAYLDTTTGLRHLAEARNLDFDSVRAAAESGTLAEVLREGSQPVPEPPPSETHGTPVGLLRQRGDWLSRRPIP